MEYVKFTWVDYTLFTIMFGLSGIVGIYFGFWKKQNTTRDYLQGGKNMKAFPVGMSLVAGTLSATGLLGIPAEVYIFGTQYWTMILCIPFVAYAVHLIFLPVFYKLQVISVFEYVELRFDKTLRTICSVINVLSHIVILPIIIYAPALAFNQVTGVNIHLISIVLTAFCIFYTTIGGVKAVVWTDTLQFTITLCILACVLVMGTVSVGGPSIVWEKAKFGDRLEFFNMNPDPTLRNSFWISILGNFATWLGFVGATQGTVQRFMAVPTYNDAKMILVIFAIFAILTKCVSFFSGLIMYAKYYDCDPLTAGRMKKADQILPYFVLDVASQMPGLSGLFLSGLFSTALSTLSTFVNSLAGNIYEDIISRFMSANTSEKKASFILKLLTLILGILSIALIFVIERLGSLLQVSLSLAGVLGGPTLGLFLLGVLFPFANTKGAFWGIVCSSLFMSVIVVKNQLLQLDGTLKPILKPLYTFGCNNVTYNDSIWINNTTMKIKPSSNSETPFWLFRISFYYYILLGSIVCVLVGFFVSWATKNKNDPPIDRSLLSPCVHRFISKSAIQQYDSVDKLNGDPKRTVEEINIRNFR